MEYLLMNPNEELAYWLQENGFQIQLLVLAPRGGAVSPENYIPEGWKLQLQVIANETTQTNPSNRVPNLPDNTE